MLKSFVIFFFIYIKIDKNREGKIGVFVSYYCCWNKFNLFDFYRNENLKIFLKGRVILDIGLICLLSC